MILRIDIIFPPTASPPSASVTVHAGPFHTVCGAIFMSWCVYIKIYVRLYFYTYIKLFYYLLLLSYKVMHFISVLHSWELLSHYIIID